MKKKKQLEEKQKGILRLGPLLGEQKFRWWKGRFGQN